MRARIGQVLAMIALLVASAAGGAMGLSRGAPARVFLATLTAGWDADAYLMDHSSFIYFVGPDGRARRLFSPDTTPEALAAALARAVAGG
ncbi:MAG: hypothetical protein ACK5V0_14355 [Alphaproteobacteria bacterium]